MFGCTARVLMTPINIKWRIWIIHNVVSQNWKRKCYVEEGPRWIRAVQLLSQACVTGSNPYCWPVQNFKMHLKDVEEKGGQGPRFTLSSIQLLPHCNLWGSPIWNWEKNMNAWEGGGRVDVWNGRKKVINGRPLRNIKSSRFKVQNS